MRHTLLALRTSELSSCCHTARMIRPVALAIVALILLAGCASIPESPKPGPSPSTGITESPAVSRTAPSSRFNLDCDDLVEGLAVEDRIPGAVLRTDPVSDFLDHFGSIGMLERFPIL